MPGSDDPKDALRKIIDFTVLAIGVVAGTAQLAGVSGGVGRLLLTGVAAVCLLFAAVRFWASFLVARNVQLKAGIEESSRQLTAQQAWHEKYVGAIGRIIDRESPLFHERLTITVTIGADDEADKILEHRVTDPEPRVTQRAIHPIVSTYEDRISRFEDLDFRARVLRVAGNITPLPLVQKVHVLRVWLVFDPSLTNSGGPVEWEVEYATRALWAPFRRDGWDRLIWHDRLPTENGGRSSLTHLTVKFVFPKSAQVPRVDEQRGFGVVTPAHEIEGTGQWLVKWDDPKPAGRTYSWELVRAADP
jgi:hypothetical protein